MARRLRRVCCAQCGRDTTAVNGLCGHCRGGSYSFASDESRCRKSRRPTVDADSPFRDEDEEEERSALSDYNGDTIRNDL